MFAFWRFLSDISTTRGWTTPNFICLGTMSADVPPPTLGSIGPWGRGRGVNTQIIGGGLICAADSYHFYFSQRCQMWFNMYRTDLRTF